MSGKMTVRTTVKISGVVVEPQGTRDLSNRVYAEYCGDRESEDHVSVSFSASDVGGTQYDSESPELFEEGGILERRVIEGRLRRDREETDRLTRDVEEWLEE